MIRIQRSSFKIDLRAQDFQAAHVMGLWRKCRVLLFIESALWCCADSAKTNT